MKVLKCLRIAGVLLSCLFLKGVAETRAETQAKVISAAPKTDSSLVLLGDVDANGKVNSDDRAALMGVIYANHKLPLEQLHAMDFNADGLVNIDDLVDLDQYLAKRGKVSARYVARPATIPTLVTRSADSRWWIAPQSRPSAYARHMTQELYHTMNALAKTTNPTPEFLRTYESARKELDTALHYGLLGDTTSQTCAYIDALHEKTEAKRDEIRKWMRERPEGRDYIESCARSRPGLTRTIEGTKLDWSCPEFAFLPSRPRNYQYTVHLKENGRIQMTLPLDIQFTDDMTNDDKGQFVALWSKTRSCVQAYWARYGVDFDFHYRSDGGARTVYIDPGSGRADSGRFPVYGTFDDYGCSLVLHEMGHWLGLGDDYKKNASSSCHKPFSNQRDSIMSAHNSPLKFRWYPRHLEQIFKPVCGSYPKNPIKK